jgi:tetratricopeptide (TPR) repeat protein
MVTAAAGVAAIVVFRALSGRDAELAALEHHTVFVGPAVAPPGAGLDDAAQIIPAMLTEELGRVNGIHVVDRMRVLELHAQRHTSPDSVPATAIAARDGGADVMLSGLLRAGRNGDLVLRLRATNLDGSHVVAEAETSGRTPAELVSNAVENLSPAHAGIDNSAVGQRAWRLYDDGLRALARGQTRSASALLAEAFTLDSAHALTAFYLNAALDRLGNTPSTELLRRSVRLSTNASPVDRLRIRVRWAEVTNDPLLGQLADSLLRLAPHDPDAILSSGMARLRAAEFLAAAPQFRRVIQLDSSSRGRPDQGCLACRALKMLATSYALADSTEAALRVQRELVAWQPDDADNWRSLSLGLGALRRFAEANAARQRYLELRPADSSSVAIDDATLALDHEDYERADRALREILSNPRASPGEKEDGSWWLAISLRQQGRLHEALGFLRRMRALDSQHSLNAAAMMHQAQVYAELGDWRTAYAMFDSASLLPVAGGDLASSYGRQRAWTLTHVARARVALGDTTGLMELADTVRSLGEMSGFGRDWRLHHFIRAQVLEERGDTAAAIAAYRRSIYSPSLGFTLANFRLGRLLIAQHRPREAVAVLRPALQGGRDASNLYVTATELHELLAKAFEMESAPDSAGAHYSAVAKAWRSADPKFRSRAILAGSRAKQLGGER